jgi:hypothetical protein
MDEPTMFNPKYDRRNFKEMITDPATTFLFPEKFTPHVIKRIYDDKVSKPNGYYEFACQQMNYPVSDLNAKFKFEKINFVDHLPSSAVAYQTIDPAGADRITADQDDTAICTTGVTPQLDLYNVDCWAEKTTTSGLFVAAYNQFCKHISIIRKVGIERNFNSINALYLKEHYPEMANKLTDYRASNLSSKDARIMALQPYVDNGKFYFVQPPDGEEFSIGDKIVKLNQGQHKLLMQMIDYGATGHDDAVDAQAATLEFLKKPSVVQAGETYEYVPEDNTTGY